MFNRKKVRDLEQEKNRLLEYEKYWQESADQRVKKIKDKVERLRGLISLVSEKMIPKSYYQTFGIPDYSQTCVTAESPNQEITSPETTVRDYIRRLELDAKESAERAKIEKIILDLKNRKWEPAE